VHRALTPLVALAPLTWLALSTGCSVQEPPPAQDTADTDAPVQQTNTAPSIEGVQLAPAEARTTDALTATVTASDAEDDPLEVDWTWTVDGAEVAGGDDGTLDGAWFGKGQQVRASATVRDPDGETATATSDAVLILNTPPGSPGITVAPSAPDPLQDLVCQVSEPAVDLDLDALTYAFSWSVDGEPWGGETGHTTWEHDTIPASALQPGQAWTCTVHALDDEAAGDTVSASTDPVAEVLWPQASRCISASDAPGDCHTAGVWAEGWDGARYEWVPVDFNTSELIRMTDDRSTTLATVETNSWHQLKGLAVRPDGKVAVLGAVATGASLTVGGDSVPLGPEYVRFIALIDTDGSLVDVRTVEGLSTEKGMILSRPDNSLTFVGLYYQETRFGGHSVEWQFFWDAIAVASLDADLDWTWASTHTQVSDTLSRVKLVDAKNHVDGLTLDLTFTQSLASEAGAVTCPGSTSTACPAWAEVDPDGTWVSLTLK